MLHYESQPELTFVVATQKIYKAFASGDAATCDCPEAEGVIDRREPYPEMELAGLPCRDDLAILGLVLGHGNSSMFDLDRLAEPAAICEEATTAAGNMLSRAK